MNETTGRQAPADNASHIAKQVQHLVAIAPRLARAILIVSAHPRWVPPLWRAARRSCLPIYRLAYLMEVASSLDTTPGAFVECGSYRGGSASVLAFGKPDRQLWLFDSWDGFPDPQPLDRSHHGRRATRGEFRASFDDTRAFLTSHTNVPEDTLHMVPGWFEESLPKHKTDIGPIALLHIDCDLYGSTRTCLEQLFSQVVPGGTVIVDDYGDWEGCQLACDEFVAEQTSLTILLRRTDRSQVVLKRE